MPSRFTCERSRVRVPKLHFVLFFRLIFFGKSQVFIQHVLLFSIKTIPFSFFSFYYQRNFPVLLNKRTRGECVGISVWPGVGYKHARWQPAGMATLARARLRSAPSPARQLRGGIVRTPSH